MPSCSPPAQSPSLAHDGTHGPEMQQRWYTPDCVLARYSRHPSRAIEPSQSNRARTRASMPSCQPDVNTPRHDRTEKYSTSSDVTSRHVTSRHVTSRHVTSRHDSGEQRTGVPRSENVALQIQRRCGATAQHPGVRSGKRRGQPSLRAAPWPLQCYCSEAPSPHLRRLVPELVGARVHRNEPPRQVQVASLARQHESGVAALRWGSRRCVPWDASSGQRRGTPASRHAPRTVVIARRCRFQSPATAPGPRDPLRTRAERASCPGHPEWCGAVRQSRTQRGPPSVGSPSRRLRRSMPQALPGFSSHHGPHGETLRDTGATA
jgi:hypothetical protein